MCCITFNWKENDAVEKVEHFRRKRTVSWAVVEVTEACNLNCKWCYASSSYKNKNAGFMREDEIIFILNRLSEAGARQVTYSGGEPSIYPHLDFAIKEAKERGMVVHVNTNGYMLTKGLAAKWAGLGVTQVQVNIDSTDAAKHDEIRGRAGSFSRALKGIGNTAAAGITPVSQTVLTSENEGEVMRIICLARKAGVERVRLWDMMLSGHAQDRRDMLPARYLEILKEVSEYALQTGAKSIEAGEPLFPLGYETGMKVMDSFCVCLAGLLANFSVSGDAYFCCMHRKPLYNVFKDAAEERLDGLHARKIREFSDRFSLPEKCVKCDVLGKCMGGCIARRGFTPDGRDYWCTE
ncbi:MAG: radical SAM protein [Candidatus Aenigmarchaeota archaeon]|nr:radical SAM protein [Candidatus Aenigmarchaeota archaeon]